MTLEQLRPGLWITSVALDDYDVRGAVIVGESRAVVWDTLSHPRDMQPVVPLVAGRELTIVYSHADWDHVWGTAGLDYARAAIVGHAACRARFGDDVPGTLAEMREREPARWSAVGLVPPTQWFESDWSIDLGGASLLLRHLPGHTRDSIVGFIPELGVLLAGDAVETPCPVVPLDSPLPRWISGLRQWAEDAAVQTVVPAHGAVGGRELLHRNIDYLQAILEGHPVAPDGPLTGFYQETHRRNAEWRPDTFNTVGDGAISDGPGEH